MWTLCSNFVYEIILIYYIFPTIMTGVNVSATVEEMFATVEDLSTTVEDMSTTGEKLNMF